MFIRNGLNKMNKILRIALCGLNDEEIKQSEEEKKKDLEAQDKEPEQTMITMSGPLGEVYTKALSVLFAKKDSVTGEITMESQANDAIMALIAAKTAANIDNHLGEGVASISKQIESNTLVSDKDYNTNAYIVDLDDFTPEDVVTAAVNNKVNNKSNKDENYFVIDYNHPEGSSGYNLDNIPYNFNLQAHCDRFNMKLVFGMKNFIKEIQPKKVLSS